MAHSHARTQADPSASRGEQVSLVLRSTLDLSDRLASKATSDPTIEAMLNEHPDPFDSYRTENEEERDVFTILPPLGMNLGLGGSKRGSVIDLDKEVERADAAATTPRQVRKGGGAPPVAVAEVLRINAGMGTDSADEEGGIETEDEEASSADEEGGRRRLETTPRHSRRQHPPPPPHDNPFASSVSSSPAPSNSSLTPLSHPPPAGAPDSPSSARSTTTTTTNTSGLSVSSPAFTPRSKQSRRAQLSRVGEGEQDPYSGDWGVPEYGPAVMNGGGGGGYDSGED